MTITITLSDGRTADVEAGTPAGDAMRAAGATNLRDAVAARVNGRVVDLYRPLQESATVEPVSAVVDDSPPCTACVTASK